MRWLQIHSSWRCHSSKETKMVAAVGSAKRTITARICVLLSSSLKDCTTLDARVMRSFRSSLTPSPCFKIASAIHRAIHCVEHDISIDLALTWCMWCRPCRLVRISWCLGFLPQCNSISNWRRGRRSVAWSRTHWWKVMLPSGRWGKVRHGRGRRGKGRVCNWSRWNDRTWWAWDGLRWGCGRRVKDGTVQWNCARLCWVGIDIHEILGVITLTMSSPSALISSRSFVSKELESAGW